MCHENDIRIWIACGMRITSSSSFSFSYNPYMGLYAWWGVYLWWGLYKDVDEDDHVILITHIIPYIWMMICVMRMISSFSSAPSYNPYLRLYVSWEWHLHPHFHLSIILITCILLITHIIPYMDYINMQMRMRMLFSWHIQSICEFYACKEWHPHPHPHLHISIHGIICVMGLYVW